MLEGVRIKSLIRHFDERGFFLEVMRRDWGDILEEPEFVQANISFTYPGNSKSLA